MSQRSPFEAASATISTIRASRVELWSSRLWTDDRPGWGKRYRKLRESGFSVVDAEALAWRDWEARHKETGC